MKCNRKQLADILGRDVKTIDKMVEQGMPYVSRPGENGAREWVFESADAIGWIVGEDKALDDALLAAKARYAAAEAGLKELEYDYRRGFMMYEDEFRAMWQQDLQTVKSLLLAMPARMGPLVAIESDPQKITKMLDDYMEIVIRPLYSGAWTYLNERLAKAQEDQRQRDAQAAEMLELAQSMTRH